MKIFLRSILLLFLFGLSPEPNSQEVCRDEECQNKEIQAMIQEDSGLNHLLKFHHLDDAVSE